MTERVKTTRREGIAWACAFLVGLSHTALRGVAIWLTWNWFIATALKVSGISFVEAMGFAFFIAAVFPAAWRTGTIYDTGTPIQILKNELRRIGTGPLIIIVISFYWHLLATP